MSEAWDIHLDAEESEFPDFPLFFGRFLVLKGILAEQDIAEAVKIQRDLNATAMFVLIERGILTPEEFGRVRRCQCDQMVTFQEALRRLSLPSRGDVTAALELVAQQHVRLGELLVRQGKISEEMLNATLNHHKRHQIVREN